MVLCGKRNQNKLKYKKVHKIYIGPKLRPTNSEKKEIERGREIKKKGSPIPVLPPLSFGIVKILVSLLGFCVKVSSLRKKCDLPFVGWWLVFILSFGRCL